MKQKISISIDDKKLKLADALINKNSKFRSKSHLIEYSLDKILMEEAKNE